MITSMSETFALSNGTGIPGVGYGTWQISDAEVATKGTRAAINAGYRHVDTAAVYGNEEAVGRGIALGLEDTGLARKDLFVTTKLWNDARGYDSTLAAFDESLTKLGLDYVDLYLIHWPANTRQHPEDWRAINADTWKAMEKIYESGRAKAIGVSNFQVKHLSALLEDCSVVPMVNQIELHPGFGQWEAAEFSKEKGLVVEAWSPLGSGRVLGNPVLGEVAEEVGRTPAQVALRWLIQKDIVVLPKSVTPERIVSNTQVFDFSLTEEQMAKVATVTDETGDHPNPDEVDF